MLSVIVPIYNIEEYLEKCIQSILDQHYKELEILLIDDGSTDGCSQICDKFAEIDHRIKVFHKPNEGLVRARKLGLKYATGDYIAFVDGDDWIDSDMYINLMEIIKNSDADFIDSGYFNEKKGNLDNEIKLKENTYILDASTKHRFLLSLMELDNCMTVSWAIWSKIFKASIIKDCYAKVPDTMQYGEDAINFIHCILNSNKIIQVEKSFYHYNYHTGSMSYLKSASLIRKEFQLWNYCGEIMLRNDTFLTQNDIDIFLFKKLYFLFERLLTRGFDTIQYYSVPYVEKLFNKRIAIYGAGRVGKDYLTQLSKYEKCQVICWVDARYKNYQYEYRKVLSVDSLLKRTFDVVLVAVEKKELADEIRDALLEKGIPDTKIIWYKPETAF